MRWLPLLLATILMAAPLALAEKDGERGDGKVRADDARSDPGDDARQGREHGPRFHADADKWVLRNDNITVWFHNGAHSKPQLQVLRTGDDGNKTGFRLQLDQLFETSADGAAGTGDDGPDDDGPAFHAVRDHRIGLHPARDWWTRVENGTDEVTITMAHLFNQGNVSLVFHVPTNGSAVKFDVQLRDWAWANASDQLALRLKVLERGAKQDGDRASFDGGFLGWAPTAQATYPNGTHGTLQVLGQVRQHGEGAHILLLFNGTGGYSLLDYDPTIGVAAQSAGMNAVPGVGAFASVAVLAVLGLALRRRA